MVGGLILSQALTLFTTPVVYLYLDQFRLWLKRRRGKTQRPALPSMPDRSPPLSEAP